MYFIGLTSNARSSSSLWIGAAQFGTSTEYENVDHTPFDFENWYQGN